MNDDPRATQRPLLPRLDALMLRVDRAVERVIPPRYNPFAQTGAIATTAFVVSAISGILLLIWYRPSVHQAYDSVLAMEAVWIGSFVRSLHRYSSDICIFFVLIHAFRLFFAGRFTGSRWLAWVSGVALIALLWFIGWTGYLLVWDEPAQLVALGTAEFLDVIPVFAEPVSRAFLANELVPSLLFFVVFFTHMLLPLVMGVGLWLHTARVQRPEVVTSRWMTVWTVGAMVIISVAVPASAGDPANLSVAPESMSIDIWYLAPLWLTDRLGAGMLWTLAAIVTGLLVAAPWLFGRRRPVRVAQLDTQRCNGCTLCARDCPYDAIVMVPRDDDRRYELQARLDPAKCVGCGICAGSCDPGGIGLPWLPVQPTRKRIDSWIDDWSDESLQDSSDKTGPIIAFLCSDSMGRQLNIEASTGRCPQLPGYRAVDVPCAGWVQRLTVERALRRGAAGVLIVGCSHSEPRFREGNRWTSGRLAGSRKPSLRSELIDASRVRHVTFDRTRGEDFFAEARVFRKQISQDPCDPKEPPASKDHQTRAIAAGVVLAAGLTAIVTLGSFAPYPGPPDGEPTLVVSVNHWGQLEEQCAPIPAGERASQPIHMQQSERCERGRSDVIIEVRVDGEPIHRKVQSPRGVTGDGPAVTLDRIEVPAGRRLVAVAIADNNDDDWSFEEEWTLRFEAGEQQVLLFDTNEGFRHYGQ